MTDPASRRDPIHIRRAHRRSVSRLSQPALIGTGLIAGTLALLIAGLFQLPMCPPRAAAGSAP